MKRRDYLAATAAVSASSLLASCASTPTRTNGRIVVIYDDAPAEDYTKAFPVHEKLDAPACSAVPSQWLDVPNRLTTDQLREMVDAVGWEVCSHTRKHAALRAFPLQRNVAQSNTDVYPTQDFHAHLRGPHYDIQLTDGPTSVTRKVTGSGGPSGSAFIELDRPVDTAFSASKTVERYPPATMQYILTQSKAELEAKGFTVSNFVAPYSFYTSYTNQFVPHYYDAVPNTNNAPSDGINDLKSIHPYALHRNYDLQWPSFEAHISKHLEEVAKKGALGLFGAHSYHHTVTQDRIRKLIKSARSRGIEVVTLRDALQK